MEAAIRAGADAVYVGLKGWSRGGARGELTPGELHDCIRLAHEAGRQLQLAVNIIPKPQEKRGLLRELATFAERGLDAVIVNDIGFLQDVRSCLPELPITVSIGCGSLNEADALFYQELGASAVVLPGNLQPQETSSIKAKVKIKLELMLHMVEEFIQLGKCWMPSYHNFHAAGVETAGGRLSGSVKRGGVGSCFKICQQPWELFRDAEKLDTRLLPSRQLSRVTEVTAFLDAGADIIKLQGRSLPPAQLGALVAGYRFAMDAWIEGRTHHMCETPEQGARTPVGTAELPRMWTVKGR
ncbi:MAG: peptidase U32 family protein [Terriglobales bacterium]